ncbi:SCO family protein [Synoicihabitans lomoniglobus]|uniref:SCO family protein n=1 Tax=Synoicihabitans lomoniglobus TaxID=2909285 RepID=UPI002ED2CFC5|nr:SCO family protein [Opitutaceae bacterium LMO-M01]
MPFNLARLLTVTALLAVALTVGCRPATKEDAKLEVPGRPVTGQIIKVDAERGTLLVDHDEIPDYMPAMVMEFHAGPGDLANAVAGERIRARLIEDTDGTFRLAHIWKVDALAASQVTAAAAALREDTTIRGRNAYRSVGENLPDFALYDQTGAVVDVSRFRGKKVLLNFIYTRCPIATMCPAATINMMAVQSAVAEAGKSDRLELISITFDPEFDTPGVLRDYAEVRGIDTTNFSFLTGPESAIKDLLRQLGVLAEVEGPLISHTLATLLIDEKGRIIDRADGSQWDVTQFVRKIVR